METQESNWTKTGVSNLVRHKSGRYYARVTVAGREVWRALKTTNFKDAKAKLRGVIEAEQEQGTLRADRGGEMDMTFGQAVAKLREQGFREPRAANQSHEGRVSKRRRPLKPLAVLAHESRLIGLYQDWWKLYEKDWQRLFGEPVPMVYPSGRSKGKPILDDDGKQIADMGAIPLAKFSEDMVEKWSDYCRGKWAAGTFNPRVTTFRRALKIGVSLGVLRVNPAAGITYEPLPTREEAEKFIPSRDQFKQLLDELECGHAGIHSRNAVEVLAYSGWRMSEVSNLQWKDVHRGAGYVVLRGHPEHGLKGRKVGYTRRYPLNKDLIAVLDRIERGGKAKKDGDRFKPFQAEDRVLVLKSFRKGIESAAKKIGIPHLHPHSFRHLFGSWCREQGMDFATIGELMGHSDGGVLAAKVYGHVRQEHLKEAVGKLNFGSGETSGEAA